MNELITDKLEWTLESLWFIIPEVILFLGTLVFVIMGLLRSTWQIPAGYAVGAIVVFAGSLLSSVISWDEAHVPVSLFNSMIRRDDFSVSLKILFDVAGVLTSIMAIRDKTLSTHRRRTSEFYALLFAVVLGAHLLVMSINFIMVFLSIELISISSYVLVGFISGKKGSEGSLKYFLFGSVASAIMLYGFSILFGLSGTLDFSSSAFMEGLSRNQSSLLLLGSIFSIAGFLFKITAAPMHIWAPDVYEAAPMPVIAALSVIPKIAGIGILAKVALALHLYGQSLNDWQLILAVVAIVTIGVGNFSAVWQQNLKRLMAYSSIAQAGFLMVGIVAFSMDGVRYFVFYAAVYVTMNYLVFMYLQEFEREERINISHLTGIGKLQPFALSAITIGLISLTGIPPTGGFSGKLFVFSAAWESYTQSGKTVLLILIAFGLLNAVVSLFYYMKIPYYAFLRNSADSTGAGQNRFSWVNFLGMVLVALLIGIFLFPGLLMGWVNSINFVL